MHNWPCVASLCMHVCVLMCVHTPAAAPCIAPSTDEHQLHHKPSSHLQAILNNVLPYQIPSWLCASSPQHKRSSVYEKPLAINTQFLLVTAAKEARRCFRRSHSGKTLFLWVWIHTTLICMSVFYERNYFLRESIDLSCVTSAVKGANQWHNLVSSWIWMKQIQ